MYINLETNRCKNVLKMHFIATIEQLVVTLDFRQLTHATKDLNDNYKNLVACQRKKRNIATNLSINCNVKLMHTCPFPCSYQIESLNCWLLEKPN